MAQTDLLAVTGLETTSGAFRARLCAIAEELDLSADFLAAVISFETAGTFRADKENPYSHFVGLIQFGPAAAAEQGTTLAELGAMTALEQLEYVRGFYAARVREIGKLTTAAEHYLAVFSPGVAKKPDSTIMYSAPSKAYVQNKGLDTSGDGHITVGEVSSIIRGVVSLAEKRPRLPVAAGPPEPLPVVEAGGGGLALLGLLGVLGLGASTLGRLSASRRASG